MIADPSRWSVHIAEGQWRGITAAAPSSFRLPQFQLNLSRDHGDPVEMQVVLSRPFSETFYLGHETPAPIGFRVLGRVQRGHRKLNVKEDLVREHALSTAPELHLQIRVSAAQCPLVVVPFRQAEGEQGRFTLQVYTRRKAVLEPVPDSLCGYAFERRFSGYVGPDEAGGAFPEHLSWHRNPQFSLLVHSKGSAYLVLERRAYEPGGLVTSSADDDEGDEAQRGDLSASIIVMCVIYVGQPANVDQRIGTEKHLWSRVGKQFAPQHHISRFRPSREIVTEVILNPGHYVISPMAKKPGVCFPFTLSVLSETRVDMVKRQKNITNVRRS